MQMIFHGIDIRLLDLDSWPTVDETQITGSRAALYHRRKNAMIVLIHTRDAAAAAREAQLSKQEIRRLFKRCTATHRDGKITGFRACLPFHHIKDYELDNDTASGTAGLFTRLLRNYPETIEKPLIAYTLGKSNKLEDPPLPEPSDIRSKLLQLCEDAGLGANEYPRKTEEGAIRTLSEWRAKLADKEGRSYNTAHFGDSSGRNFDGGMTEAQFDIDPHRVSVFDEYTVDVFVSIEVPQPDGSVKCTPMRRFKTINGRRRGSRDVSVCKRFLCTEPNVTQFLQAVEASIRPHQRRSFTITGYRYPDGPCFGSEISGGDWLLPDLIYLDSSKVHLAQETRLSLTRGLGSILYYGVVGRPKTRSDVESWHSVLAAQLRKIKCTTGTSPNDPRRTNPEEIAVKLKLQEDHLAQFLELTQATFFHSRLKSLKGKSPMEEFQRWARNPGTILRHLPAARQSTFCLAELRVEVTIWCDIKGGGQPVVRYAYAEYVGPKLKNMRSEHGKTCILMLNPQEAHIARLYTVGNDPVEIDVLRTRGEWCEPHQLKDRELYRGLKKRKLLPSTTKDKSPIRLLADYLSSRASSDKGSALKLADLVDRHPVKGAMTHTQSTTKSPPVHDGLQENNDHPSLKALKCSGDW